MSARGSRFLLPGWASAGEARGGRRRGSPDLVLGDLRRGRGALSLPTMPCDCPRGTAGADESHAGNSCCSAGPPRPPSPLCLSPLPGGPSSARPVAPAPERGRGVSRAPSQRRVLARRTPGAPGRGAAREIKALVAGCAAAQSCPRPPIYSRGPGPRCSQQVALPAHSLLPCGSFASSELLPSPSETDAVNTGQNTGRRPNHLAFPTSPLLPALGLDDGRE